jgi:hypothetical protein
MAQEATAAVRELTVRDLLDLPAVTDVETASRALGISRSHGYALARADQFPCRVVRAGRVFRVITSDLRRVLGLVDQAATPEPAAAAAW